MDVTIPTLHPDPAVSLILPYRISRDTRSKFSFSYTEGDPTGQVQYTPYLFFILGGIHGYIGLMASQTPLCSEHFGL